MGVCLWTGSSNGWVSAAGMPRNVCRVHRSGMLTPSYTSYCLSFQRFPMKQHSASEAVLTYMKTGFDNTYLPYRGFIRECWKNLLSSPDERPYNTAKHYGFWTDPRKGYLLSLYPLLSGGNSLGYRPFEQASHAAAAAGMGGGGGAEKGKDNGI